MAVLYYLDGVEESESIANETTESGDSAVSGTGTTNTQSATSNASTNEVVKLATRVESLEKYVQDLQNNVIRKNSDATLNSLTIKDRISAWWGKVGGWLIDSGKLISSGIEIDSNNSQIKSTDYASDAQGFIIRKDLIEATNIRARGSLQGTTFSYDIVSAIGGQLLVANADVLAEDMSSLDNSVLTIKGDTTFAVNDILLIRGVAISGIQEEYFRVIAVSGDIYTVTRDLAGSFSSNENPTWKKGTPVVKQGNINTISGNQYNVSLLTGGTSPSALSVFDTLGQGDNDGKIKFEIDGVVYDNVAVDLQKAEASETKLIDFHYTDGAGNGSGGLAGQTFKTGANQIRITAIGVYSSNASIPDITVSVYSGIGGTLLGSKTQHVNVGSNKFVFDTEIVCEPNTTYFFTTGLHNYTRSDDYADGGIYAWYGDHWGAEVGYDMLFAVFGKNIDTFDTYSELAARLQTAIRTQTGKEEVVSYETDHFLITSDEPEYSIKKFTAPSTGVDITGCGGTLYFDLGTNATETEGGYGDGGWLRLIGEGDNSPYYSVFKRTGVNYNNYVEACRLGNLNGFLDYDTNEFGIAIGDNNGYLKYDPTNGLRLGGSSLSFFEIVASDALQTSADTEQIISETSYTKLKEIKYNDLTGTIRIKFDIRDNAGNGTVYAKIYKNGVAVGSERSDGSGSYQTFSEDIAVVSGDLIQVYCRDDGVHYGYVRNFRIYYTKAVKAVANTINTN